MGQPLLSVHLIYFIGLFLPGLAAGSFLNVVIYRLPHGLSVIHPPSSCPQCGSRIAPWHNVPLLGWLILGGRCRSCRLPISWRYPAVELLTGLFWGFQGLLSAGYSYDRWTNIGLGLFGLLFVSTLIAVTFIDWDTFIIPDELSLGGLVAALVASAILPVLHFADAPVNYFDHYSELYSFLGPFPAWLRGLSTSLIGAVVGGGSIYLVSMIGTLLLRRQIEKAQESDPEMNTAIGFGDVKLMAFTGAVLGWKAVLVAYLLANFLGAAGGTAARLHSGNPGGSGDFYSRLKERWNTGAVVIPFGPYLAMGSMAMYFLGGPIMRMLSRFIMPQ